MAHSIAQGHNARGPDTSDKAAALRGASLAFQKKRESSTLEPPGQSKLQRQASNGALAAATISAQSTGSSPVGLPDMDHGTAKGVVMARLQQLGTQQQQQQSQSQFLQPQSRGVDTKSPSFIAATLAASRSGSPTAKVRTPRRRISVGTASTSDAVDSEHIPPTNSLISMFERGKGEPVKATLLSHDPVELAPRSGESASRSAETARLLEHAFPEEKAARRQSRDKRSAPSPDRIAEPPRNAPKKNPPPAVPPAKPSQVVKQASATSTPDPRQLATLPQQPAVPKKPDKLPPQESKPAKPAAPLSQKKTAVPKITNRYNSPPAVESSRSPRPQMIITEQPEVLSPKPKRLSRPNLEPPASPIRTPGKGVPTVQMSPGDPQKKQTPIKPKPSVRQTPNNVDRNPPRPEPDVSAVKPQAPTPPKPREPKPRHANANANPQGSPIPITRSMRKDTSGTASSNDAFYSAPTSPSEELPSPPPRRMLSVAATPSPAGDRRRRHSVTPSSASNTNMSLGSLTSAIMAGSLAASRLTPTNTGSSLHAATPRRQKSPHLKQTLRQPLGADMDEDDKHKRAHHIKFTKPRHTHHEGARKRWRDEVRPRERKRYEAVWASNRGLLLPSTNLSPPPSVARGGAPPPQPPVLDYKECVANVVVREIWRRSRLPEDELAEVWDLVDRAGVGMLTRQEFIVGMWLIDQCLKGRKTPQKVTNSVWGSTGSAGSANVKIKGPRPKGCD